tara:strand:- start:9983 stop:10201 length:219 start_codon:yes stop_codon:yes gene_type:complete
LCVWFVRQSFLAKSLVFGLPLGKMAGSLDQAGPGVGRIQKRQQPLRVAGAETSSRQETVGDTANPGTAGPVR